MRWTTVLCIVFLARVAGATSWYAGDACDTTRPVSVAETGAVVSWCPTVDETSSALLAKVALRCANATTVDVSIYDVDSDILFWVSPAATPCDAASANDSCSVFRLCAGDRIYTDPSGADATGAVVCRPADPC